MLFLASPHLTTPLCGSMRATQLVSQTLAQISPSMASSSFRFPTGLPWSVTCPAARYQSCVCPIIASILPVADEQRLILQYALLATRERHQKSTSLNVEFAWQHRQACCACSTSVVGSSSNSTDSCTLAATFCNVAGPAVVKRWSADATEPSPYMRSTAGPRLHAAAQLERGGVHERQRRGAVRQHDGVGRAVECGAPAVPQRRRGRLRDVEVGRLIPVRLAALPGQLQQPARGCARSELTAGSAPS